MSTVTKRVVKRRNPAAVAAEANGIKQHRAAIKTMASALLMRQRFATAFDKSFDGDRDLYTALGYPNSLCYHDYWMRYSRQDICKRIVEAYPDATWRGQPDVYSAGKPENDAFATQWEALVKRLRVYHYFNRVDVLAGIGQYAVLLLGFRETGRTDLSKPCTSASELLYISVFSQENADIESYDSDPSSERFGLPEMYKLTMSLEGQTEGNFNRSQRVHWSRCIHVAEGLLEDDIFGMPRLQAVYNRIEDLARVVGGSAEMFWKGAFPGYGFTNKEGADWDDDEDLEDFTDELEEYFHGTKRYLRLTDTDIHNLAMQVASPKSHFDVLLSLVAGTSGIPQRILLGSERGELASNTDSENFDNRVEERRTDFAEPVIMRPFIDRLASVGVLRAPDEYYLNWPDMQSLSEKDQADIGLVRAKTLKEYMQSGAEMLLPPKEFLVRIMNIPEEEVDDIIAQALQLIAEEEAEAEAEAAAEPAPPPPDEEAEEIEGRT